MGTRIYINKKEVEPIIYSSEEIAELIIEAGWNGEIVYLLGCSCGAEGVCGLSQEVADYIGGVVRAPMKTLQICSNGFFYVSDEVRWDFDNEFFSQEEQSKLWDERICLTY